MPFVTATAIALGTTASALITGATAVAGVGLSAKSMIDSKEAAKDVAETSRRAEALRKEQTRVQAIREQRRIFQEAQRQRALSASNLAAQGASYSSAAGGAEASIQGAVGAQTAALNENLDLGMGIFDANMANATARSELSTAQGLGDLGKNLFASSEKIGAIGSTLINRQKSPV